MPDLRRHRRRRRRCRTASSPREVAELVTAGLPPTSALDAACWGARSWLRRPGLEEGAPADLVVYPADPRTDVAVLAAPSLVVLRGRPTTP